MGQQEVLLLLKKNPNKFFSVEEISKILGQNVQATYSAVKKLKGDDRVESKEVNYDRGPLKSFFRFFDKDNHFEAALDEFNTFKASNRFRFMPSEVLSNIMIVKELKELKELMKKCH